VGVAKHSSFGRTTADGGTPVYDVRALEVTLGGRHVLGPVDLEVAQGGFVGIVGPNGSGKTTLLRALTGAVRPAAGEIVLQGRPLSSYRVAELARIVGVVPQIFTLDFSFTVEEMVAMGCYARATRPARRDAPLPGAAPGWPGADGGPAERGSGVDGEGAGAPHEAGGPHGAGGPHRVGAPRVDATPRAADGRRAPEPSSPRAADGAAVAAALEATGMTALAGRYVTELSGGERQRALIAQTLAQQTPILLLDEPLNNLDLNHQLEVMQLLRSLHAEGRTIGVVLHDLNMAAQYCDELVLLDQAHVAARGTPSDILDPRLILEVFKVRVAVHRQGRRPYLTPLWSEPPEGPRAEAEIRVHVIAGGGAASELLEGLVMRGFTPTVGIVSVFDTDYATAQRYELEVVSAPPFEPFPDEAVREFEALAAAADVIVAAPVFFGRGNLAPLRAALAAAKAGKKVIVIGRPPISERDLSDGEATALVGELLAAGAIEVADAAEAAERI